MVAPLEILHVITEWAILILMDIYIIIQKFSIFAINQKCSNLFVGFAE